MKRPVLHAALITFLLVPGAALAADPPKNGTDPAAAQALFYDARNLMQAGNFTQACPKLEESMRLDPGIGTQFNLADCNEHIGKLASAWAGFLEVAAASKTANQADREKVARKRAAALESRLPRLAVDVTGAPSGLEVKRDGIVLGSAAWGTSVPVDPGTHKVSASAPGKQPWETTVTTTEGKTARVSVPRDLPAVPVVAAAPIGPAPLPATAVAAQPVAESSFPAPVVENNGGTQRAIGWTVAVIGAAGVGVGAGFGLASLSKRNEAREHCSDAGCDPDGIGLRDDAVRNGNISTISMIAGGATLLGGLIVVLTAPRDGSSHEREGKGKVRAVPTATLGGAGFNLQGAF